MGPDIPINFIKSKVQSSWFHWGDKDEAGSQVVGWGPTAAATTTNTIAAVLMA